MSRFKSPPGIFPSAISLASLSFGQLMFALLTTRWLPSDERGQLIVLLATSNLLAVVADLGLVIEGRRRLANRDADSQVAYLSAAAMVNALSVILAVSIGSVILFAASSFVGVSSLLFLSSLTLCQSLHFQARSALNGLRHYRAVAVTALVTSGVQIVGVVVLWIAGDLRYGSAAAVYLGASALTALVEWRLMLRVFHTGLRRSLRRGIPLLRSSLSALPGTLGAQVLSSGDRLLLGVFSSPTAVALYGAGTALASLPLMLAQAGVQVTQTEAAHATPHRVPRLMVLVLLAVSILCTIVAVGAPWLVPVLFGEDYESAIPVAQLASITTFFVSIHRLQVATHQGIGAHGAVARSNALGVVAMLILVPWLGTAHGSVGAAVAMLATSVLIAGAWILRTTRMRRPER